MKNYIENYFKEARIGDKVVDIILAKTGKIEDTSYYTDYPIRVVFNDDNGRIFYKCYTIDGRDKKEDKTQRLFYEGYEPKIEISKPPKRKFKFEYEDNSFVVGYLEVVKYDSYYRSFTDKESFVRFGRIRKTKEAAEQALKLQTRIMRLHALAEQLGGLILSSDTRIKRWTVVFRDFDYPNGEWVAKELHSETCITVEMTEECAKKICKMLNSGEFDLEADNE